MKNLAPTICLVIASLFLSASTSFALPTCKGSPTRSENVSKTWHNCYGKIHYRWPSNDKYEGEWKNGEWHGKGVFTSKYDVGRKPAKC